MNVVKRNLIANVIGTFWFGFLHVALVPVYVRLLGIETFGLIAFQTTLVAIVALFDLGISVAVNRELARLTVSAGSAAEARLVTRTAELLYWGIALCVGAVLLAITPLLASRWLNTQSLSADLTMQAVALAVIASVLQFPYTLYAAGLLGLQKHVIVNAILSIGSTLRAAGAVLLLIGVAPDVRLLFAWFAFAGLVQSAAAATALYRALPRAESRFDRGVFDRIVRFARGVAASGTLGVVSTQVDKLAVSKLLPLATFGVYSMAGMIASAVAVSVSPVQITVFPRLSQIVARGDVEGEASVYHRASQTLAMILFPLAAMATLFAYDIVLLWTQVPDAARSARWLAVLLVSGATLNALSHISYAVQLAHGWTMPALIANVVQLVIMIPATWLAVHRWDAVGAAGVWAVLQLSFLIISLTITHRRALPGHLRQWLLRDVGPALFVSFLLAVLGRLVIDGESSRNVLAISIVIVGVAVFVGSALSTAVVREWLIARWRE